MKNRKYLETILNDYKAEKVSLEQALISLDNIVQEEISKSVDGLKKTLE